MTKLCNTCEYLRYCARSGIETVGCDRYKRDTTTSEEWLKSLNTEQLAEWLSHVSDFCEICEKHCDNDTGMQCNGDFKERWVEWLKQPHIEKG